MTSVDTTLWSGDGYRLTASARPSVDWLRFASHARFGQQNATYRRAALLAELDRFHAPLFLSVYHSKTLVGCYLIDQRQLQRNGQAIRGLYRGLLAISPRHRRRGLAKQCATVGVDWVLQRSHEHTLSYGCVDADNAAARAMLATTGMRDIGTQATVLKYHQWHRSTPSRVRIDHSLTADAMALRNELLTGDSLLDASAQSRSEWLTLSHGDSIATCRHHAVTFNLDPLRGISGFVTEYLLDAFPPGRRRFDPRAFRYIAVNDAMTRGTHAVELFGNLIHYLMAEYQVHFANVSLDDGDGSDSAQNIRASLGRGNVANRRRIKVLGQWHAKTPGTEVPGAVMLLSAPDV